LVQIWNNPYGFFKIIKRPEPPKPPPAPVAPPPPPQPKQPSNAVQVPLQFDANELAPLLRSIDGSLRQAFPLIVMGLNEIAKELRQLRAIDSQILGITERTWK
jgi:hypothetical protein